MTIKENIARVRGDIARVCQRIGRDPGDITLVGVTKFAPVEAIQEAIDSGITDIAENKVQEGQKKYPGLHPCQSFQLPQSSQKEQSFQPSGRLKRHLIGHLQTNKVKDALKVFDLIQSVDSLKLAQEIEKQAVKLTRQVGILVQVNIAQEEQKFGADKERAMELVRQISELAHAQILGLMTMAPLTEDKRVVRECFKGLRELKDQILKAFSGDARVRMQYLSMGMSGDYEIALEEGSNMLRIGSAIFHPEG